MVVVVVTETDVCCLTTHRLDSLDAAYRRWADDRKKKGDWGDMMTINTQGLHSHKHHINEKTNEEVASNATKCCMCSTLRELLPHHAKALRHQ